MHWRGAVALSLVLLSSHTVLASVTGEAQQLDNISATNLKPLGTLQSCASDNAKNSLGKISTSGQPKVRAQACLVKADVAIEALARGNVAIVDTRTASEFGKFRIPGSINMPAHAVKTKAFLKQQAFILVDAGHTTVDLERVCSDLKRSGFTKASVLQGGLSLWKSRGGAFEGDAIAARALNMVHPAEFIQEQSANDWLVIDVSSRKNQDSKKNFPGSVSVPWSGNHKNDKALLAAINGAGSKRVLVVDESGDSYSGIESLLGALRKNVLYLDGGVRAYLKYQREQVAMWKQRDEPPKRKGCNT